MRDLHPQGIPHPIASTPTILRHRIRTQQPEGTDLVSVGLSAPLPFNSRKRAEGMASGHLEAASAARAQYEAALDQLEASLTSTHARWTRAADKAHTYETVLIPAAEATLETTLSDFRVDKAGFSSLYEAEVDLLTLERAWLVAAAETHIQRAETRALIGANP